MQFKIVLFTLSLHLLHLQMIVDSKPTTAIADDDPELSPIHDRHRRDAADLGDLTASEAGILNEECMLVF